MVRLFRQLDKIEADGGVYWPEWCSITLEDGRTAQAIIFAANRDNDLYEEDDSLDTITPVIATAHGRLGSNQDYLLQLDNALQRYGVEDVYIRELAERLIENHS